MHRKLPDQMSEVLALVEADSLNSNGPALSPRELTHCVAPAVLQLRRRLNVSPKVLPRHRSL